MFTGAAAAELGSKEQAIAAYQRAIQISSNQPSAWQVNQKLKFKTILDKHLNFI